jgi:hypothetical protein
VKKVRVDREFVFCKNNIYIYILYGIRKNKGSYYEIYFYRETKNSFVP